MHYLQVGETRQTEIAINIELARNCDGTKSVSGGSMCWAIRSAAGFDAVGGEDVTAEVLPSDGDPAPRQFIAETSRAVHRVQQIGPRLAVYPHSKNPFLIADPTDRFARRENIEAVHHRSAGNRSIDWVNANCPSA